MKTVVDTAEKLIVYINVVTSKALDLTITSEKALEIIREALEKAPF